MKTYSQNTSRWDVALVQKSLRGWSHELSSSLACLYRQGHTVRHAEPVPAVPQRLPSLVTPLEQLPRAFSPPASLARGIRAPAALLFRARMRAPADRLSRRCSFALVVRTCASPPRAPSKVPGASATVSWPLWLHRLWECLMAFPCTSHLAVMAP
jgi:hypothetical protein